jgi:hypothetical protein
MSTSADPTRLLSQIIGPGGPELSCQECFERLDRYVELEIAGATADEEIPGMRAHLQGCPACGEDHDSLLAFMVR